MLYRFSCLEKILLWLNIIPHPLVDALSSVAAGRALQVSVKIGLVDALEATPRSPCSLAAQLGVSEPGVIVLLDCLEALGYVRKYVTGYCLSRRGSKFLAKHSSHNVQHMLLLADYLFTTLTTLEATVQAGRPAETYYNVFTPALWEMFTQAMRELAQTNAAEVARLIPVPAAAKTVLDLGGSHGLYSVELCKRASALTAEIIDFAPIEHLARHTIAQHAMAERITFRVGDFLRDDLGTGYDIVLACNIIHGMSQGANQALASKVQQALNSGGIYVILDQMKRVKGGSALSRFVNATLGVNLFQQTGGRSYTFDEVHPWLRAAGFRRCVVRRTRMSVSSVIIAEK